MVALAFYIEIGLSDLNGFEVKHGVHSLQISATSEEQ
jgi:hypothetical protein